MDAEGSGMSDQVAQQHEDLRSAPRLRLQRVILVAVLVLALGGAGWWLWERDTPRRMVVELLTALEDGDTWRAAEIAPDWLHDNTRSYAIPAPDGTGITGWRIEGIEHGSTGADVRVTVEAEDRDYPAEFRLKYAEREFTDDGLETTHVGWHFDNMSYPTVSVRFPSVGGGLMLDGQRLRLGELMGMELGDGAAVLLPVSPGVHTVELPELGVFVTAEGASTVTVPPDFSVANGHGSVELEYALTPGGEEEIERMLREHVLECTAQPDGGKNCPLRATGSYFRGEGVETGSWTVLSWPEPEIEESTTGSWYVKSDPAQPGEAVFTWTEDIDGEPVEQRRELFLDYRGWVDLTEDGQLRLRF